MVALFNLDNLTKSEYIQSEKIGSLEYISAYVPFYNSENQLLAYLNLPYFRMQSVLAREISNLIVAIIKFHPASDSYHYEYCRNYQQQTDIASEDA